MSQLLNGLRSSSSRQSDEHGVADLLEAVSRRSMSCTDEEKQEIFDMVKRVREHNHKPNAVESIQRKLSSIHVGLTVNNNNNSTEPNYSDPASPNRTKPNFVGVPSIGVPLNNLGKDIARGISILQNQLSPSKILSPLADRVDRESRRKQPMQQQKEQQEQNNDHPPGLLRGFNAGVAPTIAILPPFEDEPRVKVTQVALQQHESSSLPESDELCTDKGGEGGDVDESDQGVDQALRERKKRNKTTS